MGLQPTADLKKSLAVFSNNIHSKNIQIKIPKTIRFVINFKIKSQHQSVNSKKMEIKMLQNYCFHQQTLTLRI